MDLSGYDVRVANNPVTRALGLMLRTLDEGEVMLFKYPRSTTQNFHTYLMRQSIDMIFLDQDGGVVQLEQGVSPNRLVRTSDPYRFVVEANQGFIDNLDLDLGFNL